jgi:hypothetical protein
VRAAAIVAVLGLAACAAGLAVDPHGFQLAYLTAWFTLLSTCAGSTFLVMFAHAARARWLTALRRIAEVPMALAPVFAILAVPLLPGLSGIYPWIDPPPGLPSDVQRALAHAHGWLDVPFFMVRSALYLLAWSGVAVPLAVLSRRQERDPSERRQLLLQHISSAGIPALALVFTFAAFDWLMSLQAGWVSTVYGLHVLAGLLVSGTALVALAACAGVRRGWLPPGVGPPHLLSLGKLLLAFVCTWAWMAYAQLIVIWSADLPRAGEFYRLRVQHGWAAFTAAVVLAQFAIPFFWLLSREGRRSPARLGVIAAWLLLAHWLDVAWLVLPPGTGLSAASALAAGPLLLLGGVLVMLVLRSIRGMPPVPRGDPFLEPALRYRGS